MLLQLRADFLVAVQAFERALPHGLRVALSAVGRTFELVMGPRQGPGRNLRVRVGGKPTNEYQSGKKYLYGKSSAQPAGRCYGRLSRRESRSLT